jgi:hypothetical protein
MVLLRAQSCSAPTAHTGFAPLRRYVKRSRFQLNRMRRRLPRRAPGAAPCASAAPRYRDTAADASQHCSEELRHAGASASCARLPAVEMLQEGLALRLRYLRRNPTGAQSQTNARAPSGARALNSAGGGLRWGGVGGGESPVHRRCEGDGVWYGQDGWMDVVLEGWVTADGAQVWTQQP